MRQTICGFGWGFLGALLISFLGGLIVGPIEAAQQSDEGPREGSATSPEYERMKTEIIAELTEVIGSERVASALYRTWDKSFERIHGEIQTLKSESIEESLSRLSEIELFFTFGSASSGSMTFEMPMAGFVGYRDVEQVFSNRRVLKLLHELAEEPPARAAELLDKQIRLDLAVFKEMFKNKILDEPRLRNRETMTKGSSFHAGFGYRQSSNEDGTPVIQGVRYSLLALVMIAGILEIDGARDAVAEVTQVALNQREYFYAHRANGLNSILSNEALRGGSLYNRQALSVGLLGLSGGHEPATTRLRDSLIDELKDTDGNLSEQNPWQEGRLPDYDVFITPYGYLWAHVYRNGTTPDFQDDGIAYAYAPYVTDSDFDAIYELFTTKNSPN